MATSNTKLVRQITHTHTHTAGRQHKPSIQHKETRRQHRYSIPATLHLVYSNTHLVNSNIKLVKLRPLVDLAFMMAMIWGTLLKPHRPIVETLQIVMRESIKRDMLAVQFKGVGDEMKSSHPCCRLVGYWWSAGIWEWDADASYLETHISYQTPSYSLISLSFTFQEVYSNN